MMTVGGAIRQSGVVGTNTAVVVVVVVVGLVVPEMCSTGNERSGPSDGRVGARRSDEQATSAKSIRSKVNPVRMRGSIQVDIPGRGMPYGRETREVQGEYSE
jgi:hypothetical protein